MGRLLPAAGGAARRRCGYGLQLRYPAAAVFPELKQLAAPASLDTPPLDLDVEDHGTSAPLSVRKADAALGLLEDLLAIELLLARDVLSTAPEPPMLGAGTGGASCVRSSRRSPPPTPIRTPFTAPCATASRTVRQPDTAEGAPPVACRPSSAVETDGPRCPCLSCTR